MSGLMCSDKRSIGESPLDRKPPGLLAIFEENPKRLKRITFLAGLFRAHGFELRIAGGAVRDILTSKEPHDIDFATDATPEQSLEIVSRHEDILRIIVTAAGKRHGTVGVKFKEMEIDFKRIKLSPTSVPNQGDRTDRPNAKPEYDEESPYEITTLRRDVFSDGRHAKVEFIKDWRADAERRDLTINSMFLTLNEGKLVDYFGGESDLRNNIVKFVGDPDSRMREDYLRILRFFRFWSRYGRRNQPDEETISKMRKNMDGLNGISGERLWQELKKILSYYPCSEVVELMLRLRAFDYLGMKNDKLEDYDSYCHEILEEVKVVQDNVENFLNRYAGRESPDHKKIIDILPVVIFSCLIRSEDICLNAHRRMKFSNMERDTLLYISQNRHQNPDNIRGYKYQLATLSKPEQLPSALMRIRAFLIFKNKLDIIEELQVWEVPTFPLSGHEVGVEVIKRKLPRTYIKTSIDHVKDIWASSGFKTTKEELEEKLNAKLDEISASQN